MRHLGGGVVGCPSEPTHDEVVKASAAVVNDEPVALVQEAGSPDWWPRHANGRSGPVPANIKQFSRLEEVDLDAVAAVLWISRRTLPPELAPRLAGRLVTYRPPEHQA